MPITNAQFTLSDTTPTLVVPPDNMPQDVIFHNMTKSSNEYIFYGGSTAVGTANSIHIDPGETVNFTIRPLDEVWAISDPDGLVLGVFSIQKRD